jgi:hypothetical protein
MKWFSFFRRKQANPIDSNPAIFGELLAWTFCFEPHFGLSKADIEALAKPLPEAIRRLAILWTVLYVCWVYRTKLRAKYGDDFFEAAFQATCARLARLGDEGVQYGDQLRFWFKTLDQAARSLGATVQGVELPMEYFAALSFLGLSVDSPFFGRSDFVDQGIELALAKVLEKAKRSVLPVIEVMADDKHSPEFETLWKKSRRSYESPGSQLTK